MKRRQFIRTATASLLLPAALQQIVALAATPELRGYVFFDERFPRAQRLAASWSTAGRLTGVRGDVTDLWCRELESAVRKHALQLCGVTAESFLFCLRVLLGEHAQLDMQVRRLDRNLLRWTMNTIPRANA